MAHVRIATPADCLSLSGRLQEDDVLELQAGSGKSPLEALLRSTEKSKAAWAIEHEGVVLGIFGVGNHPFLRGWGVPWLLASDDLEKIGRPFLKGCKVYIDLMNSWYPILTNFVDMRHRSAHRWLLWLGFEPAHLFETFGAEGRPFIQYTRTANV